MDRELVLVKYNDDTSWTDKFIDSSKCKITIYDKSFHPKPENIAIPNIGREGCTYLYHIISRYNSLADITIFSQGYPFHHLFRRAMKLSRMLKIGVRRGRAGVKYKKGPSKQDINWALYHIANGTMDVPVNFLPLSRMIFHGGGNLHCSSQFKQFWNGVFAPEIFEYERFKPMGNQPFLMYKGAIFAVRKQVIQRRDLAWYKNAWNYACALLPKSDYLLERLWPYVFCNPEFSWETHLPPDVTIHLYPLLRRRLTRELYG